MRQNAIDSLVKAFPRHPDPSLVAKKLLLNTDQDALPLVRECGYFTFLLLPNLRDKEILRIHGVKLSKNGNKQDLFYL